MYSLRVTDGLFYVFFLKKEEKGKKKKQTNKLHLTEIWFAHAPESLGSYHLVPEFPKNSVGTKQE